MKVDIDDPTIRGFEQIHSVAYKAADMTNSTGGHFHLDAAMRKILLGKPFPLRGSLFSCRRTWFGR